MTSATAKNQPIAKGPTRKRRPPKEPTISIPKPAREQASAAPRERSRPMKPPMARKPMPMPTRPMTQPKTVRAERSAGTAAPGENAECSFMQSMIERCGVWQARRCCVHHIAPVGAPIRARPIQSPRDVLMIIRGGTFGPVATNTYIVADRPGGTAIIVDPAAGRRHVGPRDPQPPRGDPGLRLEHARPLGPRRREPRLGRDRPGGVVRSR